MKPRRRRAYSYDNYELGNVSNNKVTSLMKTPILDIHLRRHHHHYLPHHASNPLAVLRLTPRSGLQATITPPASGLLSSSLSGSMAASVRFAHSTACPRYSANPRRCFCLIHLPLVPQNCFPNSSVRGLSSRCCVCHACRRSETANYQ